MSKIIKVKVGAGAKSEKVEEVGDGAFRIRVTEPPDKGKANKRVLELVAKHFDVSTLSVRLVSGNTYREKVIEVDV